MTSCTILDDDDPDWLFEFKYDGFRALCYLDLGRGRFVSRNGNLLSRFDDLACLVAAELEVDEAILDGEVIAPDETGRTVFFDLLRSRRKPAYVVFDLLWLKPVPTFGLCPSATGGGDCRAFCQPDP